MRLSTPTYDVTLVVLHVVDDVDMGIFPPEIPSPFLPWAITFFMSYSTVDPWCAMGWNAVRCQKSHEQCCRSQQRVLHATSPGLKSQPGFRACAYLTGIFDLAQFLAHRTPLLPPPQRILQQSRLQRHWRSPHGLILRVSRSCSMEEFQKWKCGIGCISGPKQD